MRFCLEVKKQRGETIQLFVDFLRLWYTRTELEERLELLSPDAKLEREYVLHALNAILEEETAILKEYLAKLMKKGPTHTLQVAEELVAIRGHIEDWFVLGCLLDNLGRYEESLESWNKAIELGHHASFAFFNRAKTLLALNRWDEGSAALDDALNRFAHADEPDTGDTAAIICNLFNSTKDAAIWKTRITTLITLYNKHQVISALGQGLVRSIPALMSEMVSDKAAQTWLEVWQELTSDYTQFQIPLRLLNTAVRYRETKGDKRVLLELPIEERNLLKPLLGISEGGQ
jgi:tetratricopeptide (TPR) repeat protein